MAKHKFKKPPKDGVDEKEASRAAHFGDGKGRAARLALAAKGKDLPGPVKDKDPAGRMKSRYGA